MSSAGCCHGAVEDCRWSAAPDAVAMMGSLEVIELHEPVKAAIERRPAGEVVPAKDHAPVLGEDRLLQALHEAVGPGMARLDARVADPQRRTRRRELGFELSAPIREHALDRPAGLPEGRNDHRAQERRHGGRGELGQDSGDAVRTRRVARRDLPDLADSFELADVEGVETEQLAGTLGLDVTRVAMAQPPEQLPRALCQQAGVVGTVVLEHEQALPASGQAVPPQETLHGAGRHPQPPQPLRVGRQALRAPGRFGDRDGEQAPFDLGRQLRNTTRPRPQPPRMQAVDSITAETMLPPIEQSPGDARLRAGRAYPDLRRTTYDLQPHPLYALVEGHRSSCPKVVSLVGFHSETDRADGPHFLSAEVSTLMRLRTV